MAKTHRKEITDGRTAKQQSKADAERDSETVMQEHTAMERAAAEQSFELMEAALQEAVAALNRDGGFTAALHPLTVHVNGTPETCAGHILTVRRSASPKPLKVTLNYRGCRITIGDDLYTQPMSRITTPGATQNLVREILNASQLI